MRAHRIAAGALAATLAIALPARAALFDDDEARKRIEQTNVRLTQMQKELEDRIAALETQLKAQGLVDLLNSVEQMRSDIAKVHGQLEVITYELDQANKRQRDLYVDVDSRLRKLETAAAAAPSPRRPPRCRVPPVRSRRRRLRRRVRRPSMRPASSARTTARSICSRRATTAAPRRASRRS